MEAAFRTSGSLPISHILDKTYVERLSESNQLEALKDLINTYRFLRVWDKVEVLASTLEKKASTFYLIPQRLGAEKYDKPLFAYIAQSYLVRANVCEIRIIKVHFLIFVATLICLG